MQDSVHKGHRARMKREFLSHGLPNDMPPHKVLELLLFYCLPQKDTNPLAHSLINKYNTLSAVLEAPIEELVQFKGLTESNAPLLKLILPIARYCMAEQESDVGILTSLDAIGDYIHSRYIGLTEETLSVASLDGRGRLLAFDFLESGDLSSVGFSGRKLVKAVLSTHAEYAVLAHNHPSGIALPSPSDITITDRSAKILARIGVKLIDHVILAKDDYVSLSQSHQYNDLFVSPSAMSAD